MSVAQSPQRIVVLGAALIALAALAAEALSENGTMALLAGALIAELGCGKLGVAWNDPLAPIPTTVESMRRVARGVGLGVGVAVLVGAAALLAGARPASSMSVAPLGLLLGLFEALFFAVRSELLERGILWALLRRLGVTVLFVPLAVVLAVASRAGRDAGLDLTALTASASLALLQSLSWKHQGGALVPIVVHATLRFLLLTLLGVGGLALHADNFFVGSDLLSGGAAVVGTLVVTGVLWFRARRAPVAPIAEVS